MNITHLRPACELASFYGVKMVGFGPPGVGKTPLVNTAPRPVMLAVEPGLLSMRTSQVPTWAGSSVKLIDEFFDWFFGSYESKQFDTLAIDSVSQIAEIYLHDELYKHRDPRKAYGEMSRKCMEHFERCYFMEYKHIYLIAKQGSQEIQGTQKLTPYFPGKDLNVKVPHRYDLIAHIANVMIPNLGERKAIRTKDAFDISARDRSGKLAEFEPCDLAALFAKIMG